MQILRDIVSANKSGKAQGIYSVCSAHPMVLEAAFQQAKQDGTPILIESTANQVNQFGGYTGMQPADFKEYINKIAGTLNFPKDKVILGGDHLGPVCWVNEPAAEAMKKAHELIAAYVVAGFKKIHLDCSMPCADDSSTLSDEVVAERAATLCATAEKATAKAFGSSDLVYVIGTEVPPPGGTDEEEPELEVTPPQHAELTLETHRYFFDKAGLNEAWSRVIAIVVQPGVEFSHTSIVHYKPSLAQDLSQFIREVDGIVFEAHSTDYQHQQAYKHLVRDHFAILKVGPQLTFALREALYALSHIEDHLIPREACSNLQEVCEERMLAEPKNWSKYYQAEPSRQKIFRHFSYSDRIRYYWPDSEVSAVVEKLISNLSEVDIPAPLVSQYFPEQYKQVAQGILGAAPQELIRSRIRQVTEAYALACWKQ